MDKQTSYWIQSAQYDYKTAIAMLKSKRYLYVAFMCHQTLEKALKAIISNNGSFPPKIHILNLLAEKGGIEDILTEDQTFFLTEVNPLNVESRYPSDWNSINAFLTEDYCKQLIAKTEDFLIWVKNLIQQKKK